MSLQAAGKQTGGEHAGGPTLRDVLQLHGSIVADLAAFDGDRLRAFRMIQDFTDGLTTPDDVIDHTLVHHLGGSQQVHRYDGHKIDGRVDSLRKTTMMPARRATGWQAPEQVDVLQFYIDDLALRAFAERELGIDPAGVEVIDYMGVDDQFIRDLAPVVLREMKSPLPTARLMLDSLDVMLAGHVLRAYTNLSDRTPDMRDAGDGDEAAALARARAYMAENLGENIGLDDMAAHAGLTPFVFARKFRASVGMSPYQYLLHRRIARARDLLSGANNSIADIAYACGFSSQAHMTTVFGKHLGIAPGAYRREVRT